MQIKKKQKNNKQCSSTKSKHICFDIDACFQIVMIAVRAPFPLWETRGEGEGINDHRFILTC